ncbi:MAG: ATP-binding protein [bacterium]
MANPHDSQANLESLAHDELLKKAKILSERVKKLEELVEIISRGKYMWESTFDAITSPVQIVSEEFEILRANLSLAASCGKDIAAVIGMKCYEVFAGRDSPCRGCPLPQAIESDSQRAASLGNEISKHEYEASAYPLAAGSAEQRQAVMHYRDVTEECRLQREVIQQEKMAAIGMLAGGVAHEINNPLGGILAFTQLMKRDAKDDASLLSDLVEVENAAIRCKKIVSDLLDFSRVSKERDRKPVDVNVLLENVFPFLQREMRSLNVELKFKGRPDMPKVTASPDRIQQVFINLLTNACHAMPKGGRLDVSTGIEDKGRTVVVRMKDTGMGMPRDICDRIFDPFFTTKEPGKGTGLGLSISYRIVRDHGGEITCESIEGEGTEFVIRLPACEEGKGEKDG